MGNLPPMHLHSCIRARSCEACSRQHTSEAAGNLPDLHKARRPLQSCIPDTLSAVHIHQTRVLDAEQSTHEGPHLTCM